MQRRCLEHLNGQIGDARLLDGDRILFVMIPFLALVYATANCWATWAQRDRYEK